MKDTRENAKRLTYILLISLVICILVVRSVLILFDKLAYSVTQTASTGLQLINQATICGCGYADCDCNQLTPRISPTPYWKFTPTWIDIPAKPTWTFSFISPTPLAIWTFPATRLIPSTPTRILTSTIPPPKASWTFMVSPTFLRTSTSVAVTQPATIIFVTATPTPTRTPTRTNTRVPTSTQATRTATPTRTPTPLIPPTVLTGIAQTPGNNFYDWEVTQLAINNLTSRACALNSACATQYAESVADAVATNAAQATQSYQTAVVQQLTATWTPFPTNPPYIQTNIAQAEQNFWATNAAISPIEATRVAVCPSEYTIYCRTYSKYERPSTLEKDYCNAQIYYFSDANNISLLCIVVQWVWVTPSSAPTPTP